MKKITAFILVFSIFLMSFPASAMSKNVTSIADTEEAKYELSLLSDLNLPLDKLISSSTTKSGVNVYDFKFIDGIISRISVLEENGDIILDIVEGDCHDVLKFTSSGGIYLDNTLITPSASHDNEQASPASLGWQYLYQETPFKGTSAGDYNILVDSKFVASYPLEKQIRSMTISALSILLGMFASQLGIVVSIANDIIFQIAGRVKDTAERLAPTSTYLSYKLYKYQHPDKTPITLYHRYYGVYYVSENYQGQAITNNMYEYMYLT